MNHPSSEEFVPYVFGEAKPEARRRLRQHLAECAECRDEVERWKQSLNRLDAWRLPRPARYPQVLEPLLRWAVAGAMAGAILLAGFAAGRFSSPKPALAEVRQEVAMEVRQQLHQELARQLNAKLASATSDAVAASVARTRQLLTVYAQAQEARRAEQARAIAVALDQLDRRWQAQRVADYMTLKEQLDTVAVNTDAGLRQLADARQPDASPSPAKKISIKN
jgi:Putative zinc-finger